MIETRIVEYATHERRGTEYLERLMAQNTTLSEERKLEILAAAKRSEGEQTPRPRRGRSGLDVIAEMQRGRRLLAERRKARTAGNPAPRLSLADQLLVSRALSEEIRFEASLPKRR